MMRRIIWIILFGIMAFKVIKTVSFDVVKVNDNNISQAKKSLNVLQSDINISDLVLTGSNQSNSSYIIKSSRASQISEDKFVLKSIDMVYDAPQKQIKLFAGSGLVNRVSQEISLQDKIKVLGKGYTLESEALNMNLNDSLIKIEKNVAFKYIDIELNSDKCDVNNDSMDFKCHGKVRANIHFDGF